MPTSDGITLWIIVLFPSDVEETDLYKVPFALAYRRTIYFHVNHFKYTILNAIFLITTLTIFYEYNDDRENMETW